MPIRARTALASSRGSVMSCPSSSMTPSSMSSSRSMHRSSVDLPEPDAPISTTTRCASTSSERSSSTRWSPNDLRTDADRQQRAVRRPDGGAGAARLIAGPRCRRSCSARRSSPERSREGVGEPGEREREQHEQDPGHDVGREVGVLRGLDLRGTDGVDGAEDRDEARVLGQRDQVVQERRDHVAHGLRQHHVPQRLPVRQAERPGRGHLGRVHGLDPGPEHLRHVRRVGEHEREPTQPHRRRRDALQAQTGQPEADEQHHEDQRQPTEDVDVRRPTAPATGRTRARAACA